MVRGPTDEQRDAAVGLPGAGGVEEAGGAHVPLADELVTEPPAGDEVAVEQERYAAGARYMAYDAGTSLLLGLAAAIIVARVFGVHTVGAFALATLLTGAFGMVSNLRQQSGLVRELTRYRPGTAESRALTWMTLAFSVALTIALFAPLAGLGVFLLHEAFHRPAIVAPFLVLTSVYALVDVPALNLEGALIAYRDGRGVWLGRTSILAMLIIGAGICWLVDLTSLGGLVAATAAGSAAGFATRLWAVNRLIGLRVKRAQLGWARHRLRWVISFGLRSAPTNYTETVIEYADSAVLAANVALSPLGAYNRAYQIFRRMALIPLSLSQLYFPTLSALFLKGSRQAMARVYRLTARYLALLLLPLATWLAIGSRPVMGVFGGGFGRASTALAILAFVVVVDTYGRLAGAVSAAADKPGRISIITAFGALVNVGMCFALIPSHGLTGAALANLAGFTTTTLIASRLGADELRVPYHGMFEPGFLLRLAIACAVMAAGLLPLRHLEGAIAWLLLAAPPLLALGLVLARPLERGDEEVAERALRAAGVRSPRVFTLVIGAHRLISHEPAKGRT